MVIALGLAAGDALAQRPPYRERPDGYSRDDDRGGRQAREHEPGVFDYYLLALSWSPTYCADIGEQRRDPQCSPRRGGPTPSCCTGCGRNTSAAGRRTAAAPTAASCPGRWRAACSTSCRASGWCSTSTASTAPARASASTAISISRAGCYDKVKIPPRFVGLTDTRTTVSPGELMQDFMAANPELEPDMIVVQCGGAGNRLKEVRICFDKGGDFRACGRNENQARLCCAQPHVCATRAPRRRASGASSERPDSRPPESKGPPLPPDTLPGPRGERRL